MTSIYNPSRNIMTVCILRFKYKLSLYFGTEFSKHNRLCINIYIQDVTIFRDTCGIRLGNTGERGTLPKGELCCGFFQYVRKIPPCYPKGVLFLNIYFEVVKKQYTALSKGRKTCETPNLTYHQGRQKADQQTAL